MEKNRFKPTVRMDFNLRRNKKNLIIVNNNTCRCEASCLVFEKKKHNTYYWGLTTDH